MLFEEINKAMIFLKKNVPNRIQNDLKHCKYNDLVYFHFTLGAYIRNELLCDTFLYDLFKNKGIENKDDMSHLLICIFYLFIK